MKFKHVPRLYVDYCNLNKGDKVILSPEHYNHIIKVFKKKINDDIKLFCNGNEFNAKILEISKKNATLIIENIIRSENITNNSLTLLCAVTKPDIIENIIHKTTELGIDNINFIKTSFCKHNQINFNRIKKIAISATQQSERLFIPTIEEKIFNINDIDIFKEYKLIYCDEKADNSCNNIKSLFQKNVFNKDSKYIILIGPEGGFSQEEREFLYNKEFCFPVTLGKYILKVETATIASISQINLFLD